MNLFSYKTMNFYPVLTRSYALKLLCSLAVLIFISACGTAENREPAEGMATLSVTIPGLTSNRQGQKGKVALRTGVPDEVTSILIEVLNDKGGILDSAEIIGTDGTVVLSIAAGENYTIRGSAFAGQELLFLGEANIASIKAGSSESVSLTLDDQIILSVTSPGDIEVGVGETSINFNLTGLNDIALRWYVNGVVNGSSEFGFIDDSGRYTAPVLLPANPFITIIAEPVVSPSFAQSFSFNLLPADNVNNDPVANAGVDQSVVESSNVTLDGSASNDSDGSIVSFNWTLISGSGLTLDNATTANPEFTAPMVTSNQTFVFQLRVTDNDDASSSDTVSITVAPLPNIIPVANAGADQTVNAGDLVTLSAAASNDVDGSVVGYSWLQVSEDVFPVINNTDQSIASFVAPSLPRDSVVIVELTVTDNDGAIHSDSVSISILRVPNIPPVANAGVDQTVNEQTTVNLNGSTSDDSDGSISSYSWLQTAGGSVTLSDALIASPDFSAPTLTTEDVLVFELTVTDNEGATHADSVSITVQPVNADPVANAGVDIIVNAGVLVNLSAAASSDTDGSINSYSWTQISTDLNPVLNNADTETPSFTAPSVQYGGIVTYRLRVTDNEGAIATDDITITVNGTDQPLVANAGLDQVVTENTEVTLDGSASNDPDNAITTYFWEELSNGGLVLSDSGAQMPTFNAPDVTISTNFYFRLTVTNDNGDQSQDTITITVNNVVVGGNNVYFAATQDFANHTIWVTDGTAPGTQQVTTVETSNFDILASKIIGDYLYFSGNDGSNGTELWRTNGVNTEMFASAPDAAYVGEGASASGNPSAFSVLTDKLLYRAVTSSLNGSNRSAQYLSLNTVTEVVTPLSVVNISSFTNNQVGTFNGFSYFYRNNTSPAISTTLYKTDGINNATLVASFSVYSEIHDFVEVNGELFFVVGNNQLWKTDGTEVGTTLLKTFTGLVGDGSGLGFSGEKNAIAFNNNLIFVADDGEGRELWLSDGTIPGTILVRDLDATVASSNPTEFNIVNGRLLFLSSAAGTSTDGLWQTDGTNIGTVRLSSVLVNSDINSYEGISTGVTTVVDSLNLMFFTANDGLNGNELWVTDGTAFGTSIVKNLNTLGNSQPATFRAGNGFLIFTAQDDDDRAKLWRTDGTDPGTTLIRDINPTGIGNSAFFPLGG